MVRSPTARETVEPWQRSTTRAAGRARRGSILLLLATGPSPSHAAQMVGVQRRLGRQWATRVLAQPERIDLYTRRLRADAVVRSVDEQTS